MAADGLTVAVAPSSLAVTPSRPCKFVSLEQAGWALKWIQSWAPHPSKRCCSDATRGLWPGTVSPRHGARTSVLATAVTLVCATASVEVLTRALLFSDAARSAGGLIAAGQSRPAWSLLSRSGCCGLVANERVRRGLKLAVTEGTTKHHSSECVPDTKSAASRGTVVLAT